MNLIISIPSLSGRIGGGKGYLERVACKHGCGIADGFLGEGKELIKVDGERSFIILDAIPERSCSRGNSLASCGEGAISTKYDC